MRFYLPVLIYLLSALAYQAVAKTVPDTANPFAMLTTVYFMAAVACAILAYFTKGNTFFSTLFRTIPKSAILLGMAVIGLEASMIYAYRLGWQVSLFPLLVYALLSVALLFMGAAVFSEDISVKKLIGIALCLGGLAVIRL